MSYTFEKIKENRCGFGDNQCWSLILILIIFFFCCGNDRSRFGRSLNESAEPSA